MLWTRVLTALVLVPAVLAALFFLDEFGYGLVFLGITGLALVEWGQLCGIGAGRWSSPLLILYGAGYLLIGALLMNLPGWRDTVMLAALLLWVLFTWRVVRFGVTTDGAETDPPAPGASPPRWADALSGYVVIAAAFAALLALRAQGGPTEVLSILLIVWLADIGAYFSGRAFGRRKLAPRVSPGKTWEGVVGGAVLAIMVVSLVLMRLGRWELFWIVLLPAGIALSVIGDLYESTLKRRAGVKDSGRLLPGHGGMLDRVDAMIPALPLFALCLSTFATR